MTPRSPHCLDRLFWGLSWVHQTSCSECARSTQSPFAVHHHPLPFLQILLHNLLYQISILPFVESDGSIGDRKVLHRYPLLVQFFDLIGYLQSLHLLLLQQTNNYINFKKCPYPLGILLEISLPVSIHPVWLFFPRGVGDPEGSFPNLGEKVYLKRVGLRCLNLLHM